MKKIVSKFFFCLGLLSTKWAASLGRAGIKFLPLTSSNMMVMSYSYQRLYWKSSPPPSSSHLPYSIFFVTWCASFQWYNRIERSNFLTNFMRFDKILCRRGLLLRFLIVEFEMQ